MTTEQLRYQLAFIDNMDRTSRSWWDRFAWYPRMQECHFRRIDQIYLESRQMFGDDHFLRYAARRRLAKKYTVTASEVEDVLASRQTLENDGGRDFSVPRTTNGEYGRVKPTSLHQHMC